MRSSATFFVGIEGGRFPNGAGKNGGRNWIRTSEGVSQQIYSLPPLATWVSYRCPRKSAQYAESPRRLSTGGVGDFRSTWSRAIFRDDRVYQLTKSKGAGQHPNA